MASGRFADLPRRERVGSNPLSQCGHLPQRDQRAGGLEKALLPVGSRRIFDHRTVRSAAAFTSNDPILRLGLPEVHFSSTMKSHSPHPKTPPIRLVPMI